MEVPEQSMLFCPRPREPDSSKMSELSNRKEKAKLPVKALLAAEKITIIVVF